MVSRRQEILQRIFRITVISLIAFLTSNQAANYDGYKVYQLYPDTLEKIAILKSFEGVIGYDFWLGPRSNISKLMVSPKQQHKFEKSMAAAKISINVIISDVAMKMQRDAKAHCDREEKYESGRRTRVPDWRNFSYDRYLRYDEMWELVRTLAISKSTAKFFNFGTTSQGRKMFGVKLSISDKNPVILIDGGIHAREWAAPMSVLYILQRLIENDDVLENLTFYIIPLVNPDGYEHTHTRDRFWRKTMSRQPFSECLGVDANRNFDSHWNEFGAESEPCSPIYSGPKAFSEPETQAMRDLIKTIKPVMYITFHTYGGQILYPWGFTKQLPPNWEELDSLGNKAAAEVRKLFRANYTVGSSTNVLYAASGGSDDWSMEKASVPLVYCIELEDYGSNFELPVTKLNEIVQHADTLLKIFMKHVERNYRFP